jgi:hypothetical protein
VRTDPEPTLRAVPDPEPESEGAAVTAEATDILDEFRAGGGGETSMEETLAELHDDESTPSGPNLIDQALEASSEAEGDGAAEAEADAEVHEEPAEAEASADEVPEGTDAPEQGEVIPMTAHRTPKSPAPRARGEQAAEAAEPGSLTLTLSGNMSLRLQYDCEGQSITVGLVDHCLVVALADGTEFKIPVRRGA